METIDDLHRVGGPLANAVRIQGAPIATDHFDTGMCLKPLRNRPCRAIGKQIDHPMAFEITEDRPKASSPPPGPLVDADGLQG